MQERIQRQLAFINSRAHRKVRRSLSDAEWAEEAARFQRRDLPMIERYTRRLESFLEKEEVVLLADTRIQGQRTLIDYPDLYLPGELEEIGKTHHIHEKGKVCNLACDYDAVLREGLEGRRARALRAMEHADAEGKEFLSCALRTIDAAEKFALRYADALEKQGDDELVEALRVQLFYGARTLVGAMQSFRMLHFVLWASGSYHNTVGRMDQYLYPYYLNDKKAGMRDEDIEALFEDFLLSFNRDSDLYYSLQWGDNGQSVMLGGCKADGSCAVNELTSIIMKASLHIRQIDPKLNLRVDKNTPLSLYMLGTELTREGMGFPQYANDDVVIPGLVRLGYDIEDARNYTVAACWEFIIPGVAMDIPNIDAVSLAAAAKETIRTYGASCSSLSELWPHFSALLRQIAEEKAAATAPLYLEPAPYLSVLMTDCLDQARDISKGAKYNNYGFHGTGFANAVDQFAALDAFVYGDHSVDIAELDRAVENDFENDRALQYKLRVEAPKVGRDPAAKAIGDKVLDLYAQSLEGLKNERGGIFRAGTGSAMYYLWHADNLGATYDGRGSEMQLPANFSPSLTMTGSGPFSIVSGFTPPSLYKAVNGGPLTLEIHDTVFRAPDAIEKVAKLVQAFALQGGHQLQLNAVNREKLRDAQAHPENHRDLIVRVWGWSGHFTELDRCYQDQIIARTEYDM